MNVPMASKEGRQASHEIDQRLEDLGRRAYNDEFYLRYYVGHKGDYGHEFMVSDDPGCRWCIC